MQSLKAKRNAQCPRCGYDLRGVMSLWEASCPLMGKCSECGLDYEWAIVSQPEKYEPGWCVEFSPGWLSVPKSAFKTFCCSFVPWYFWSRLHMSYSLRLGRLLAYLGFLLFPILLVYVMEQAGVAIYVRQITQNKIDAQIQTIPQQIAQNQNWQNDPVWKASLEQLTESQREERIKFYKKIIPQRVKSLKRMLASPPYIDHSYMAAIIEAVLFPLSNKSSGMIIDTTGTLTPYSSPSELHSMFLERNIFLLRSVVSSSSQLRDYVYGSGISFAFGLISLCLYPLAFVLLPVSRKKAKVKWFHFVRVAIYSAFIPIVVLLADSIIFILSLIILSMDIAVILLILVTVVGNWIIIIAWWAIAIRRYLKVPHGLVVSILLCVLIVLVMSVIGAMISGALTPGFRV